METKKWNKYPDRVREISTSYQMAQQTKKTSLKRTVANWLVIVHKSRYGYDVHCPALPGCNTQGDTLKEALKNVRIAIEEYLQAAMEIKKEIKKGGYLVEARVTL